MPHICIIIHICRIFLVNYAVDFLILSIFKGDFHKTSKNCEFLCKNLLTFMHIGRIVCIVKGKSPIYIPHSGSNRATS